MKEIHDIKPLKSSENQVKYFTFTSFWQNWNTLHFYYSSVPIFFVVVLETVKDRTDLVSSWNRKKDWKNPEFAAKNEYMVTAKLVHEGIFKEQEKYKKSVLVSILS